VIEPDASGERPALPAAFAVEIADLSIDLPVAGLPDSLRPVVRGLRLTARAEALEVALVQASAVLSQISRARVEDLLDQMAASVWLRPLRPYYAMLFRLAAVENGLEVTGRLAAGAIHAQARFRSDPGASIIGQLRDRAKGAASVRLRIEPSVGDEGRLRLRIAVEPDVRGIIARAVVGAISGRPGVRRLDDATVDVDLDEALAAETSAAVTWNAPVRAVRVDAAALTIDCGAGDRERVARDE
jgi:hypothetical protein